MSFEVTTDTPSSPPPVGGRIVGCGPSPTFSPDTFSVDDFLTVLRTATFILSLTGLNVLDLEALGVASPLILRKNNTAGGFGSFHYNGPSVGSITTNGSATSFNTSSDYRLKEDERDIAEPIERLLALRPLNFAWKTSGLRSDGFFAHEVAEVVPEAVRGDKDAEDEDGMVIQQLDQSKLVPLLVAALQAEIEAVRALADRIAAIEARLAD